MSKHFTSFEDLAADENFLAWYADAASPQGLAWQQWLEQNPQYRPLADEACSQLNALRLLEKEVPAAQTEAAIQKLKQALAAESTPLVRLRPKLRRWWIPAAAAAVLLIVAGAFFWKSGTHESLKLNTAYGQVRQYQLPDGSEVMLNANSQLSMQPWTEGKDREVWIDGEAFFHVRKTTTKNRFIVHARQIDIIVTGTQFNVVNREGEASVLLKEGSVTLKSEDGKLLKMVPGDFVTLQSHQPQKQTAVPEDKVLAWTQARLVFENTPLQEAQKIISRHYGIAVRLSKDVEDKTLSGILPNDNLDVLLKALEATGQFRIERKDNEILISASPQ